MFGSLGTWWDHRPLWQKIGLGVAGLAGAAFALPAIAGGGGAAASGAAASGATGAAGASGAGALSAGEIAALNSAGPAAFFGGAGTGADAVASMTPLGASAAMSTPTHAGAFAQLQSLIAAHPGYAKYGKIAASNGYNMYQDHASKMALQDQKRRELMAQLMAQNQRYASQPPAAAFGMQQQIQAPPVGPYRGGPF